jgi:hypothetical protein
VKPLTTSSYPLLNIAKPEVLAHIRDIIKHTVTPSWLSSVPHQFRASAAGTLKADEWHTMFMVYLPLALVSVWGEGASHASSDEAAWYHRILDHTMALISAVIITCMWTMTTEHISAYCEYTSTWVWQLTEIHPEAEYRPNYHMGQRIHDFLLLFRPVRSWWCFPFKRVIRQLQWLPINHKFGEPRPSR